MSTTRTSHVKQEPGGRFKDGKVKVIESEVEKDKR